MNANEPPAVRLSDGDVARIIANGCAILGYRADIAQHIAHDYFANRETAVACRSFGGWLTWRLTSPEHEDER